MKLTKELLDTWEKDCGGLPIQQSHTRLGRAIPQIRRLLEIEERLKTSKKYCQKKFENMYEYLLTGHEPEGE